MNTIPMPQIRTGAGDWRYVNNLQNMLTFVTPAANTKGIVIRFAAIINDRVTAILRGRVMHKSSAPTSVDDALAKTLAMCIAGDTGQPGSSHAEVTYPIIIPPGEGLYAQASAGLFVTLVIDYEILT